MPTPRTTRATRTTDDGWPDAVGDTALSIHVPEADHLVRTPARAHVTVLYPFLPLARLTEEGDGALRALLSATPAFTLTFRKPRRWPGVLYLAPSPAEPLRALTRSLRGRWPEAVPYRGVFGDAGLEPHLTLASGPGTDDIPESDVTPHLPLASRVTEVRLIVSDGRGTPWRDVRAYPLSRLPR
ncbi:2'-5' RNA ligase family protein [Streptomyces sp. SID8379]|uniref:2'-5' RNA ligase family protein n=1 Tax=unclassified Streptomyces TaxID=2593676 RepID=UPI0003A0D79E|nr:2'-5' RNA ligase family protein [Streptomyces sp. HmicA12]MYW66422.1 2'-5' RNA ligase family protein [Streptomyces sp. SID8379]